jgi:ribosomal protein S2
MEVALQSTSSLAATEIAPNSEETPVVQILNPNNSDNDIQLVEPVNDTATSEIATDITETPIQHARKRALLQLLFGSCKDTLTMSQQKCQHNSHTQTPLQLHPIYF